MDNYTFLIITHIIGTALGAGGATVGDFLFFRSIKDNRIDKSEFNLLKTVSNVVWTGLTLLILSGFGFFILYRLVLPEAGLIYDAQLWAKISIVMVILFNGLLMHIKVFPLLESSIGKKLTDSDFVSRPFFPFSTGVVSIISWYSALILGAWRELELPYLSIMGIYVFIVMAGIIVSNMTGKFVIKNLKKSS